MNNIIQLEVEDSGEGITPENLVKVLDPFFTTRSTLEHAGLGLSMVSGILRQHSAQMQLKSKPGEGTTITIKLPTSQDIVQPLAHCLTPQAISKFDGLPSVNMMKADNTVMSSSTMKMESAGSNAETIIAENELFKSLNLFDDEDAIGDFQFGRLEFKEEVNSTQETSSHLSLGEKAAQEVLQEMIKTQEVVVEPVPVVAVPSKKLKKKAESYSKIKVQIPRPEEKI